MSEVASAKGELRSVLYQALSLMGSIGLRLNSCAGEIALGVSDGILVSKLLGIGEAVRLLDAEGLFECKIFFRALSE